MKIRSVGINAVLNTLKTLMTVVFPLITFPYVSRILQTETLGNYNFCVSIVNYFILLAGLGINSYAIREGARYRNDAEKMSDFASEIFSINIISTVFSYVLLIVCVFCFDKLYSNMVLLLILSISIFFKTIGCEWIFNIYEDFLFITVRTIVFQALSMILLFLFVKTKQDVWVYALITVVSNSGANMINYLTKKKYCSVKFVINKNLLKRLSPILVIFANSISIIIYVNSDITMIGLLSSDYATGLYTVASKIYLIVKELLSAMIVVSVPRLSALVSENKKMEYDNTANTVLNMLLLLVLPAMIGLFALSRNIILLISGEMYVESVLALKILSFALVCCIFGWFYTSCVLMPYKKEKTVLKITISVALINIFLNILMIPKWGQNAAAFTTFIAEGMSMLLCYLKGKKYFCFKVKCKDLFFILLGNVMVYICCSVCNTYISNIFVSIIIAITSSILCYGLILLAGKNMYVTMLFKGIKTNKILDRRKEQ